eukprot:scaffold1033_cov171-Amphora_coffeaeformis.AAC.39
MASGNLKVSGCLGALHREGPLHQRAANERRSSIPVASYRRPWPVRVRSCPGALVVLLVHREVGSVEAPCGPGRGPNLLLWDPKPGARFHGVFYRPRAWGDTSVA